MIQGLANTILREMLDMMAGLPARHRLTEEFRRRL